VHKLCKENMVPGMSAIKHDGRLYDTCVVTKQRRAPFPAQAKYCAENQLELVHGDLCRPVSPATPGGRRCFLLLVDDATRYMWVSLLTAKSATADAIKHTQGRQRRSAGASCRCFAPTTARSSPPRSSPTTAPTTASRVTTLLPTRHSRTVWWSGEIKPWWAWRGPC